MGYIFPFHLLTPFFLIRAKYCIILDDVRYKINSILWIVSLRTCQKLQAPVGR